MRTILISFLFCVALGCKKTEKISVTPQPVDTTHHPIDTTIIDTTDTTVVLDTFITYIIPAGANYVLGNSYLAFSQKSISFKAIFDSSCIYTNVNPVNQADINKLYGFSDCNTFHQINSARFGWNWKDGAMHIHAYCYSDTVRIYKELGTVPLNAEVNCKLEVVSGYYVFTLNGFKDSVSRHCTDTIASGYKLLPFFGGDEMAPHEIRIKIKELK